MREFTAMVVCGGRYCNHPRIMTFNGAIQRLNKNEIVADPKLPPCEKCDRYSVTKKFAVLEITDTTWVSKTYTVQSFPSRSYMRKESLLKSDPDEIRNILTQHGFVFNDNDSDDRYMIYNAPDGIACFVVSSHLKTQKLFLILPPKHKLFKDVATANAEANLVRKAAAPPKPEIPTFVTDCIGSRVAIGDWVAYSSMNYTNLQVAQVVKISPKTVSLKTITGRKVNGKAFAQIVKLPEDQVMIYRLSH